MMCRSDVAFEAVEPLAQLLSEMASQLARQTGVAADSIVIGPVDFGPECG